MTLTGKVTRAFYALLMLLALAIQSASSAITHDDGEFLIGLIPEENIFRQVKKHKPFEAYLSRKLGVKVSFTILSRYPDIIDRFTSRNMDGAIFGAFTAALARDNLGVVPIARQVNEDETTTAQGCLFVGKNTGIKTVADMKNRRIAFVDMATATGYLFAIAYMKQNGINDVTGYFSERFFTGSHDTAVYTVLSGRAEVGAAKCRVLQKLSLKDPLISDEIVILARSPMVPDNTLCIRADTPRELRDMLTSVLLNMHKEPEGREVLKSLDALKFVPATWGEFKSVDQLLDKAGINIKQYQYR